MSQNRTEIIGAPESFRGNIIGMLNTNIGERKAVRRLVRHLQAAGWSVPKVWDGGEWVRTRTIGAVVDTVFSVDDSLIHAVKGEARHNVYIVLGNAPDGSEIVCDYGFTDGDPDGFDAVMSAFE